MTGIPATQTWCSLQPYEFKGGRDGISIYLVHFIHASRIIFRKVYSCGREGMTDPLEVPQWHEERSDRSFKPRPSLAYKSPAPLNMSAQEILDWIEEMRPEIDWQKGDEYVLSGVYVILPEISKTFGKALKDAVCLAAAKWEKVNE